MIDKPHSDVTVGDALKCTYPRAISSKYTVSLFILFETTINTNAKGSGMFFPNTLYVLLFIWSNVCNKSRSLNNSLAHDDK